MKNFLKLANTVSVLFLAFSLVAESSKSQGLESSESSSATVKTQQSSPPFGGPGETMGPVVGVQFSRQNSSEGVALSPGSGGGGLGGGGRPPGGGGLPMGGRPGGSGGEPDFDDLIIQLQILQEVLEEGISASALSGPGSPFNFTTGNTYEGSMMYRGGSWTAFGMASHTRPEGEVPSGIDTNVISQFLGQDAANTLSGLQGIFYAPRTISLSSVNYSFSPRFTLGASIRHLHIDGVNDLIEDLEDLQESTGFSLPGGGAGPAAAIGTTISARASTNFAGVNVTADVPYHLKTQTLNDPSVTLGYRIGKVSGFSMPILATAAAGLSARAQDENRFASFTFGAQPAYRKMTWSVGARTAYTFNAFNIQPEEDTEFENAGAFGNIASTPAQGSARGSVFFKYRFSDKLKYNFSAGTAMTYYSDFSAAWTSQIKLGEVKYRFSDFVLSGSVRLDSDPNYLYSGIPIATEPSVSVAMRYVWGSPFN